MPAFIAAIPAWIAANAGTLATVGSLAGAGATIGSTVVNAENASNQAAQQQALLKQQQDAAANQANLQKQEAILGSRGNAQEATGGNLTDTGFSDFISQLAGYPGGGGTTATAAKATSPGTVAGGAPTPDIATILATLQGGQNANISGGATSQLAPPQQWFELANPVA